MDCNNCFFSDDCGGCLIDGCCSDCLYVSDDLISTDSSYEDFLDAILNEQRCFYGIDCIFPKDFF